MGDLEAHVAEVVERLAEGKVTPFFGAGVNLAVPGRPYPDPWKRGELLPTAMELAQELAAEFEYPLEEGEQPLGAEKITDLTKKELLDLYSCTECGRCQNACPAWNTGKPLSPKLLVMNLRDHLFEEGPRLLEARSTGGAVEKRALSLKKLHVRHLLPPSRSRRLPQPVQASEPFEKSPAAVD